MSSTQLDHNKKTIVVVGLGMVGLNFIEKLIQYEGNKQYNIVSFCEEPIVAYNRVGLTQYFTHRSSERLIMQPLDWYQKNNIQLFMEDKVVKIDNSSRQVISSKGNVINYDKCVIATGSYAWRPPVKNIDKTGVFVYRTIDDLNDIIAYSENCKTSAVIGGGLLGLEAAKALLDLGLKVTILERNPRLMARQLDKKGGKMLANEIAKLNIESWVDNGPKEVILDDDNNKAKGILFEDGKEASFDMIIVAAGIKPRDDVVKGSNIISHPRGGILIDDNLQTNDPHVFAIGEVALHAGMIYGLVAPGYEMAEVLAKNLCFESSNILFKGGDLSSKLKLLGVNVASFGDYFASSDVANGLVYTDPFGAIYKKYLFSKDGKRLLGGIMVGDTTDYTKLHALCKSKKPLTVEPGELILGVKGSSAESIDDLPDEAQVCSCNNVSKGQIRDSITKENGCRSLGEIKSCTKAGTGCGGCMPLVTEIFQAQMKSMGQTVKQSLCPHFSQTRVELFQIIKIKKLKTFKEIIEKIGKKGSMGCEVCKPAIASILASLWNDHILDHANLQDTNDKFLANIQRGGSYSIVPRVPGGEITPEKIIAMGEIAKKYGLYTKITGGQRIDMFGCTRENLPYVWEDLVNAGFESGHAYGKALRTVKSCVGSSWCRYGIGDSVGFAIRIENRYRGIRSPHKLKGGVSGCIRECAEAQGKDFGLIATDKGFNVYVCGNGGAKPKHAVLLAKDVPEELCIKYLDRFLMYYIHTADKLTLVINDHLGICEELEKDMERLINTYQCEWAQVVKDPKRRNEFRQFVNTEDTQTSIEIITERGQKRPADWPKDVSVLQPLMSNGNGDVVSNGKNELTGKSWVKIAPVDLFPDNSGKVIKYGDTQIAIFNSHDKTQWYATQNMCPHKRAFVLADGILGDDENGVVKVSCPMHKKNFSLESGECISDEIIVGCESVGCGDKKLDW
ncbi:6306_t:CDS:2 [Entrophospora sp. SA101]|nr:6306_t:CDS:2 [Entrophospora sp. SA101]CAJ0840857.1 5391_t:CDS:2 [Entrophospora sp. SA101]